MKTIVACTGAGMSAESGLRTFRDSDGLWEQYPIEDVATPEAWQRNPALVMEFYNQRRKQVIAAQPNPGHVALAKLEQAYRVHIVTQNIDDLHERAGSSSVLHLHGEVRKSRSSIDPDRIYPIDGWELRIGEKCELGSQLRPHVVWFGEAVPAMDDAYELVRQADIFIVIGTSLAVYPAASLVYATRRGCECFFVDPAGPADDDFPQFTIYRDKAGTAVPILAEALLGR